jgi:hypothetical protein
MKTFKDRAELYHFVDTMYDHIQDKLRFPKDENLWPLMRAQLIYRLVMAADVKGEQFNKRSASAPKKAHEVPRFARLRLLIDHLRTRRKARTIQVEADKPWLLFGFSEHYYQAPEGKRNLYLSPFRHYLDTMRIAHTEWLITNTAGGVQKSESAPGLLFNLWLRHFGQKNKLEAAQQNWEQLYTENIQHVRNYLSAHSIGPEEFDLSFLYWVQREYGAHYPAYYEVLKRLRPQHIWTYCYYDLAVMTMIKAAHALNIPVTEYQHSAQSDAHFAYAKWKHLGAFKAFLPDAFWEWSNADAERLRNNLGEGYTVIDGGNLGITQDKSRYNFKTADAINSVLICLQGLWLPDYIEEMIRTYPGMQWYLRWHPRYPHDKERAERLHTDFPESVNIKDANAMSIQELLTHVTLNITEFSGTALEADAFDVPTLITGERGEAMYSSQLQQGLFVRVNNAGDLLRVLNARRAFIHQYLSVKYSDHTERMQQEITQNILSLMK